MRQKRKPFTFQKKKKCPFCADKDKVIDYKDPNSLKKYISDRGKIMPGKMTGVCAKHQRKLTIAIKRARIIALLPFISD